MPAGIGCATESGAAPRTIGLSALRSKDTGWTFVPPEAITWGRPRVATGADGVCCCAVDGVAGRETAIAIGWLRLTAGAVAFGLAEVERQMFPARVRSSPASPAIERVLGSTSASSIYVLPDLRVTHPARFARRYARVRRTHRTSAQGEFVGGDPGCGWSDFRPVRSFLRQLPFDQTSPPSKRFLPPSAR